MAVFRQYNIQLLPLDTKKTKEVGVEGYKKLFSAFNAYTTDAYKKKKMADYAMSLINDTFICPFVVHVEDAFAYGSFLKFHMAETVTEFYTQERLFEAPIGTTAISNQSFFRFVFDYENHRFGIEENSGKLPAPEITQKTLLHFLQNIADHNFPNHILTINLISDPENLRSVFSKGNEFGHVHVKITFPNSRKLNDTLQELLDCNAHSISAEVSPERGARMLKLPKYISDLIKNAPNLGEAKVIFYKKIKTGADRFKKFVFSTSDYPKRITLRQKKNENETTFIKRVWLNIKGFAETDNQ